MDDQMLLRASSVADVNSELARATNHNSKSLSEAAFMGPGSPYLGASAASATKRFEKEEESKLDAVCNHVADLHRANEEDLKKKIIEVVILENWFMQKVDKRIHILFILVI